METADWHRFTKETEIVIVTRFSFLGESGFKSDFSHIKEQLFDEDRLNLRLMLFETLTLPSLAAQTDKGFHLFILTSGDLPRWAFKRLAALCGRLLPAKNFTIARHQPGKAGVYLRRFLTKRCNGVPSFQVVLDDDDALAADFLERLRTKMGNLAPPTGEQEAESLRFVSFAQGYALLLRDLSDARLKLFAHRYPYINLGLAMVAPAKGRNILSIAHRKVPKQHVHAMIGQGRPMFLRCVHSANDSRVNLTARWQEIADWRKIPDIRRRFSFLTAL